MARVPRSPRPPAGWPCAWWRAASISTTSRPMRWRPNSTPRACPIPTSWSAPAATRRWRLFCCGSQPTPSSSSSTPIGPNLVANCCNTPSMSSAVGNVVSAASQRSRPASAGQAGIGAEPMSDESEPGAGTDLPRSGRLGWLGRDFNTRLIWGIALALFAAGALYVSPHAFHDLAFLAAPLSSWEWGRLVHGRTGDIVVAVLTGAVVMALDLALL